MIYNPLANLQWAAGLSKLFLPGCGNHDEIKFETGKRNNKYIAECMCLPTQYFILKSLTTKGKDRLRFWLCKHVKLLPFSTCASETGNETSCLNDITCISEG